MNDQAVEVEIEAWRLKSALEMEIMQWLEGLVQQIGKSELDK